MSDNINADTKTLKNIRNLSDFDLRMLLSEVNDHGWEVAKKLIPLMQKVHN